MMQELLSRVERLWRRTDDIPAFQWAEVRSISPLKIRFDGVANDSAGSPSSTVHGLKPGDRVLCLVRRNRVTVIGSASTNTFATKSALNAWSPADGALAFLLSDGRHYERVDGVWRAIQARHITDASNGRAYFGTGENATGSGESYLGMSPTSDSAQTHAMWFYSDGVEVFRIWKSGSARVFNDLHVDGRLRNDHLPTAMAAGSVAITSTGAGTNSATVTFPAGRFSQIPLVTVSPETTGPNIRLASVFGISSNSMTIYLYTSNATTVNVAWQAVQMGA